MHFSTIVRHWCKIYRPMLDDQENGNRRFYLTDSTFGMVELAKRISNKFSPCVVMESSIEGYVDGGRIYRNYPIYFFVRARDMADGDAAAEAKEEAWLHAQNFLTWLLNLHENDPTTTGEYSRISMEDNIDIMSIDKPIENGWYAVMLQLTRLELMNLCNDENLYTELEQ